MSQSDFTIDELVEESERDNKLITLGRLRHFNDLVSEREDEKILQAREVYANTTQNFDSQTTFVSKLNALYLYTDSGYFKFGDGVTLLKDLPYIKQTTLNVQEEVVNGTLVFSK